MEIFTVTRAWIETKLAERSTWDGTVIVVVSACALLTAPIVKYIAILGLGYGAYRIYQDELLIDQLKEVPQENDK